MMGEQELRGGTSGRVVKATAVVCSGSWKNGRDVGRRGEADRRDLECPEVPRSPAGAKLVAGIWNALTRQEPSKG